MDSSSRNTLFEFYRFSIPITYCASEPNSYYAKYSMTITFEVPPGIVWGVKGIAMKNCT